MGLHRLHTVPFFGVYTLGGLMNPCMLLRVKVHICQEHVEFAEVKVRS